MNKYTIIFHFVTTIYFNVIFFEIIQFLKVEIQKYVLIDYLTTNKL